MMLLRAADWIWTQAGTMGLAERVVIVLGSDVARTPSYNDQNGKDHWSVTSMMLMGAGVSGNRVVGGTDAQQQANAVDPSTLQVVSNGGLMLRPGHVHQALRKLAGLAGHTLTGAYALPEEALPIV
jgi:hypothetical protein